MSSLHPPGKRGEEGLGEGEGEPCESGEQRDPGACPVSSSPPLSLSPSSPVLLSMDMTRHDMGGRDVLQRRWDLPHKAPS